MNAYRVFLQTADRHRMLPEGGRIVAAVSGGPDSTALLLLLRRAASERALEIHVAHLDHGVRGERGREEQEHVRRMASRLDLVFHPGSADARDLAWRERRSLEEAARIVRYRFLEAVAQFVGADRIATGHTLDDQAETVLLRLLRGAGPRGLASLHPVVEGRPPIVRPLIALQRRDLERVLASAAVRPFRDETNLDPSFDRNRLRQVVMPVLEECFRGRASNALARAADILRVEDAYLEGRTRELRDRSTRREGDAVIVDRAEVRDAPLALGRRLLRDALESARGTRRRTTLRHVDSLLDLALRGEGEVTLPGGFFARADGVTLRIDTTGAAAPPPPFDLPLPLPGRVEIPAAGIAIECGWEEEVPAVERMRRDAPSRVYCAAGRIAGPLRVRSRRRGDRYRPLGFATGTPRLARVFVDRKIPRAVRDKLPLVVCGDEVLWVPGLPPSDSAKVDSSTERVVFFQASPL